MNQSTFVLCVCILTVLAHIGLLWLRGWVIGQLWKEFGKMKAQWLDFRAEQEEWRRDFENNQKSPWTIGERQKRTA